MHKRWRRWRGIKVARLTPWKLLSIRAAMSMKPLLNTPPDTTLDARISINGLAAEAHAGEYLIEALNRVAERDELQKGAAGLLSAADGADRDLRHVHGGGGREAGARVRDAGDAGDGGDDGGRSASDIAQREAFDRILQNHDALLHGVRQQQPELHGAQRDGGAGCEAPGAAVPATKPYEQDISNPFYRYDPDQCILCGRCVEACQNVQVNETLTIDWESAHPRVLWDGGEKIEGSSCVCCGHCVTVCPCNALMEKSMLGHAGYLTDLPAKVLDDMIEVVKGDRADDRLWADSCALRDGSGDAHDAREADQDGVHLLRRGLQLRCVDARPAHPEDRADGWTGEWDLDLREGQVCVGLHQLRRPADEAAAARGRYVSSRSTWDEALDVIAEKFTKIEARARAGCAGVYRLLEVHERRELPDAEAGARGDRHEQHRQLQPLLPDAGDDGLAAHGGLRRRLGVDLRISRRRSWW